MIDNLLKKYPKSSVVQTALLKYYNNLGDAEKVAEIFKNIELNDAEYYLVPLVKFMDSDGLENMSISEL